MKKRIIALVMVFAMVVSGTSVLAQVSSATCFDDVPDHHWAKGAIKLMEAKGIISGHNGDFRPNDSVSRGEFSKMLVKTLGLTEISPNTPSFTDVRTSDWEYTYVETAKNYLTGFTSGTGFRFKPDEASVREDMAVAVIKGLYAKGEVGNPDDTNLEVLDRYKDQSSVSPNLRKYVAAAINEGIMVGDENLFSPMGNLTRAQAATLLARLIDDEQKVVFDDEGKVVIGDATEDTTSVPVTPNSKTPVLEKVVRDNDVVLEWTQVPSTGFKYYKVVVSEGDSSPSYPDNGYAKAISNVESNRLEIASGDSYNGGDIGGVLKGGKTYYVAITAVYSDGKYTSDVERMTMPGSYEAPNVGNRTPALSYDVETNGVELNWTQSPASGFSYYKVVLSQTKENPYYPDYGYLAYISDAGKTSYMVYDGAGYNDGSKGGIGGYVEDEGYYMTITAVYNDGKYTSNSVYVTVPDK